MQQLKITFLTTILTLLLFSTGTIRNAESSDPKHAPSHSAKAKQHQYDEIVPFQNSRYQKIKRNGKWGCLDSRQPDKELISPKYDDISDCDHENSRTKVKLNGKWGYIDLVTGETVIPFNYDDIAAVKDNDQDARVKRSGKWGYLNIRSGKEFIALQWDEVGEVFSINRIIDTGETRQVRLALSMYDKVTPGSEGRTAVSDKGKWGFVDETGKKVIPLKYDQVGNFSDGLAAVGIRSPDNPKILLYGFIDRTGKEIVEPKYTEVRAFYGGLAPVRKNSKWGFIDKTGKEIVPPQYRTVNFFHEGLAAVCVDGLPRGKCGFVDKTGNVIVPPEKYIDIKDFSDGMAAVTSQSYKTGFIDRTGKEIIPSQFEAAGYFSEGLAAVYRTSFNKWGFIDKTGKVIIPFQYDKASPFIKGRARVTVNDKHRKPSSFLIDKSGEPQPGNIPEESLVRVRLNDKWGYIDGAGTEVFPVQYDALPAPLAGHRFNRFKLKGKYGYLGQKANVVVPSKYDEAPEDLFGASQELRIVRVSANGKYGYLSRDTGEEMIPVIFDDAPSFGDYAKPPEKMKVKRNGKWGYIDLHGKEVSAFRYEDDPCAFEKGLGDHYVFGDHVEIKERPDASSTSIAILPSGTNIEVLEKTDQELTIGDVSDTWYKVKYQDKRGYVWGAALADSGSFVSINGKESVVVIRNRTRDTDHCYHRTFEMQLIVDGKIIDQLLDKSLSNHAVKVRALKYESFSGFSAPLNFLVMTFDGNNFEFADHALSRYYYYVEGGKLMQVLDTRLKWDFRGLKGTGTLIMPDRNAGKDAVTLKYELSQPFFGEKSGEKHYIWSWEKKMFLPAH